MEYKIILTNKGKAKVAAAIANSTTIKIKHIVFGDGNGSVSLPDVMATTLKKEVYRTTLNSITIHPENKNWVVCEGYIPADKGNFWIREIGLIDEDKDLIAIGNYPETYKPTLALDIETDLLIKAIMEVSDTAAITLIVDPSAIMATREWVMEEIKKNPSGTFIGMITSSARKDLPAGWVRLDGAAYTQEMFPQFYALLTEGKFPICTAGEYLYQLDSQNGSCGFFVLNAAAKAFKMPTITDGAGLMQALNSVETGRFYGAAIKNIAGDFGYINAYERVYASPKGLTPFSYKYTHYVGGVKNGAADPMGIVSFDASRVVPTAEETRNRQIRYPFIMHIANAGDKEISEAIWNGFLNTLENKANTDLSNTSANIDYVVETYKNGFQWYRKYKSGWIEQGEEVSTAITGNGEKLMLIGYLKNFADEMYTLTWQPLEKTAGGTQSNIDVITKTKHYSEIIARACSRVAYIACGMGE
ncbi:MAG: phage tail protein [Campylobacteraceae bacterium]|jgi:hypothetical protein|nr:phage tail protein [Campylobacteraceae bacterium]